MDNASKALIMAGAILISVMLVSLGVMLFSSASSQIEGAIDISDTNEVLMFNNQFLTFQGDQRGVAINQLITKAIASNAKYYETVTINGATPSGDTLNSFERNGNYSVSFDYNGDTGLISNIVITG